MPERSFQTWAIIFTIVVCFAIWSLFSSEDHKDSVPPMAFRRRIVAVGDLHGDFDNAVKVLRMSGVIDDRQDWTGDIDYLVQTGDIIDRGDDTLLIYSLMNKLRGQARSAGGDVLSHLGNHEIMNAIGDWRYVPETEIETFGSVKERQRVLSTGWIGQSWRSNYTITSRLPYHPSQGAPNSDFQPSDSPLTHAALSFVHGGISATYSQLSPYPSRINSIGLSLLEKLQDRPQPPPYPPNPYPGLPSNSDSLENELYGSNGPVWYRGWAQDDEDEICPKVDSVLRKIGVRRMVMGHTPTFDHMVSRCDGRIIVIDTGISRAYGGILSALDIRYSLVPEESRSFVKHIPGRFHSSSKPVRFQEEEVIRAIYPTKSTQFVRQRRIVEL